jgi:hypothetical protein
MDMLLAATTSASQQQIPRRNGGSTNTAHTPGDGGAFGVGDASKSPHSHFYQAVADIDGIKGVHLMIRSCKTSFSNRMGIGTQILTIQSPGCHLRSCSSIGRMQICLGRMGLVIDAFWKETS